MIYRKLNSYLIVLSVLYFAFFQLIDASWFNRINPNNKVKSEVLQPTVFDADPFYLEDDVKALRTLLMNDYDGDYEKEFIEILALRSEYQRKRIARKYKKIYHINLAIEVDKKFNGPLLELIVTLITPLGEYYANEFYNAIKHNDNHHRHAIIELFNSVSNEGLYEIGLNYRKLIGRYLLDDAMRVVPVKYHHYLDYWNPQRSFREKSKEEIAEELYAALIGPQVDHHTLIKTIVSRSEVDLGNIKDAFEEIYDESLISCIDGAIHDVDGREAYLRAFKLLTGQ